MHGIVETNYDWIQTEEQYGYNAHCVVTMIVIMGDPPSTSSGVMEESYLVDDLALTYCSSCPVAADQIGGWSVNKRREGTVVGANVAPDAGVTRGSYRLWLGSHLLNSWRRAW